VSELTTGETVALRLAQIEHSMGALQQSMTAAGFAPPSATAVHEAIDAKKPPTKVRESIRELHVALLSALTVADYRLGKAYGLGRALCDTTRSSQPSEQLAEHLHRRRLGNLIAWCEDLKTVLPAHVAQATADSLRAWATWAYERTFDTAAASETSRSLHRQGERWRALLTGEKDPLDLLDTSTYVKAAEDLLSDAAGIARRVVRRFWVPLVFALVLLAGGVVVILQGSASNAIAGLASIATSLGISWKTLAPSLTSLARKLADPLWGAELDGAIVLAVTQPEILEATANASRATSACR